MTNPFPIRTVAAALAIAVPAATISAPGASAQSAADFYKGKQITHVVSYGAGGSYTLYSRLIARLISKHIPGNPTVVVTNMPGAGGLKATNYLYNVAPKDGTYSGMVTKDLVVAQVLRPKSAKYDARKFNWIGRASNYVAVVLLWSDNKNGVRSFEDIKKKQTVMGVSGRNHHGYLMASMLNHLVGTKFKLVTGYRGAKAMNLAMERGEVDARIGSSASLTTQLASQVWDGKLKVVLQSGEAKDPGLPDVPLVRDLLQSAEDKQAAGLIDSGAFIGWSVLMPPAVPGDRVQAVRRAFDKTVADTAFLDDAKKRQVPVSAKTGEQLQDFVGEVLKVSPALVARARMLVGIKKK